MAGAVEFQLGTGYCVTVVTQPSMATDIQAPYRHRRRKRKQAATKPGNNIKKAHAVYENRTHTRDRSRICHKKVKHHTGPKQAQRT